MTALQAFSEVEALNAQASALVRRGLQLVEDGRAGAAADALACFDRALAIRVALPVARAPHLQYDLAGTWLNRAAILADTGRASDLAAAMAACDAALTLLCELPLAADPRFPRRLAIAYQNLGMALLVHGGAAVTAAITAFRAAIRVVDNAAGQGIADGTYLLATAWVSLADAQATDPSDTSCRDAMASAGSALHLVRDTERTDPNAAAVGLKARHVFCRALARCLPPAGQSPPSLCDDVHLGTDAADEGLALARHWQALGTTRFQSVADDLFRFGARLYARYQPQFLCEFVIDHRGGTTLPDDRAADGGPVALALVFSGR